MIEIKTIDEMHRILTEEKAVFVYFSHQDCSVCKVLKPKVSEMLSLRFPLIRQVYVDTKKTPEISGQYSVFTVPVIICFFDGRETIRKTRNFGIGELIDEIQRPYTIIMTS
jgi:thioredoxin 1